MKVQIIGYITAMINNYANKAIRIDADISTPKSTVKNIEGFIDDLKDLLDFVEDIPEEKQDPITVTINYNGENLTDIQKYLLNQIKNTHFREVTKK